MVDSFPTSCPAIPAVEVAAPVEAPIGAPEILLVTGQMCRGDESAYRTFYSLYANRLLRYLLVVTGGREEASREALQLTLLRIVRHMRPFASETAFWSWLTVLARSSVIDEQRKGQRYRRVLERFLWWTKSTSDSVPVEADNQLQACLDQSLDALSPDDRALIEAKYIANRSVKEIALEHQTTEKAVDSRLVRLRKKLKEDILAQLKHEQSQ